MAGWSLTQTNICPGVAIFGVDIMLSRLESTDDEPFVFQPKVLEVQWAPDCTQGVKYIPTFWDDMILSLFLDLDDSMVSL